MVVALGAQLLLGLPLGAAHALPQLVLQRPVLPALGRRVRRAAPNLDKVCPQADLSKFDGIVTVAVVDGCLTTARAAFDAYVLAAAGPEAP